MRVGLGQSLTGEGNIGARHRLAEPALPQTIVVPCLSRASLRIDPSAACHQHYGGGVFCSPCAGVSSVAEGSSPCSPLVLHISWRSTELAPEPITTSTNDQPPMQEEGVTPSVGGRSASLDDESRSSLLASDWYSTSDLAACLHVDASTPRRWRTAHPRGRRSSPFRNASSCTSRSTSRNGCAAAGPSHAEKPDDRQDRCAGRRPALY